MGKLDVEDKIGENGEVKSEKFCTRLLRMVK